MAVIRDMIPAFELFQPTSVDEALSLLDEYGNDSWVLAGGLDSFDWFKDRIKRPKAVVELGGIAELRGVHSTEDGLEIGAMTTLTEVAAHTDIQNNYGLLSQAAIQVATPQIRNQGTLGGNIAQDTRCWYYRAGWPCYRAGGNICYASAPEAMNREHCIFGADRCVAVSPSDTAPALVALDASMVMRNARRERTVTAEDFFMRPAIDITRMTVLDADEILTAIHIPNTWAGSRFYFEKVADRNTWDFALVSVAAAMSVTGGVINDLRLVCGAVQCTPRRMTDAENAARGKPLNEATAALAGAAARRGAKPLNYNHFKVPLVENLIKRAIRNT